MNLMESNEVNRGPIKVFYYYDDKDEEVVRQIEKHCIPLEESGKIKIWHQGKITPGQIIELELLKQLKQSEIIIMMVSADLLVSELFREVERISIERAKKNLSILIPVYLKPCLFTGYNFTEFKMVPSDGEPVVKSGLDLTERCNDVAIEIHNLADTIEGLTKENDSESKVFAKTTR